MTIFVPAARVSRIKISPTTAASARVRELKAAGRDIIDMAIGEPDFDTPDHVKVAAHEAIDRGETKYTAVNGTVSLRKAIIADYKRRLGLEYADNEICAGGGAKRPANDRSDGTAGCITARGPGRLPGHRAGYRVSIPRRPHRLADAIIIRVTRRTGILRHRRARRARRQSGGDRKNLELC